MGDSTAKAEVSADSGERLNRIQEMLDENEALRKQKGLTSVAGILILLLLLSLFVYRLYAQGQAVVSSSPQIAKAVWQDSQPAIEAELAALKTDLRETAMPEVNKAVRVALEREMPKFEVEAREMGSRLYDHGRQTLEARLIETLGRSLEESNEELEVVFPDMSSADLQESLKRSGNLFVERSYEVIELHVGRVTASVEGLKQSVQKVAESKGAEHLDKTRLDWAEEEVISALTDLVVYELKPALGEQPATSGGGAK